MLGLGPEVGTTSTVTRRFAPGGHTVAMQLSLLQSRLLASLAASLFILALYLFLFSPNFAQAAEMPAQPAIHLEERLGRSDNLAISYEPDFGLFDRSILGRAPPGVRALGNNAPVTMNVEPGKTECFMVEQSALFSRSVTDSGISDFVPGRGVAGNDGNEVTGLKPRADSWKTVYLSVNTCLQPQVISQNGTSSSPPQLTVYVSNSSDITCPGPSSDVTKIQSKVLDEGAVMYKINATGDTYISVSAPELTAGFSGVYHFEIAASLDEFYHSYDDSDTAGLQWMDSDSNSVLLSTKNLTQDYDRANQVMKDGPPYELFAENNDSNAINGLRHSICGLIKNAQISANRDGDGKSNNLVKTMLTTRGPGGLPKQQFYFMGLNTSSSYSGILVKARKRNSESKRQEGVLNGGGTVFSGLNFQTLSGTNCQVVTDLEFCTEIQYAAPGNNDKFNNTALAQAYDDYAKSMYANFEKVLMQIPCEAPPESKYSLARNCEDCKKAYKRWLCTVSIPRCEDIFSNNTAGIPRSVGLPYPNGTTIPDAMQQELGLKPYNNASRNAFIDTEIQPGPYKEILPCEDVCYEVVQSCPAAMNFRCPQPHMPSFNISYGQRYDTSDEAPTCNFPGEPRTKTSAANPRLPAPLMLGVVPLMVYLML